MREDQGYGLGMFVDDKSKQILAVDLLQKAEWQGLDRLPHVIQRQAGPFAQRPLDKAFSNL